MSEHHGHHATTVVEPEIEDQDVEAFEEDETEEVETPKAEKKAAKAKATRKRGDLPKGYVTPVGFAHLLTEWGYGGVDPEDGEKFVVPPQMVYSYIKNAPKDHPFPIETVKDSLGTERQVLQPEQGRAWWDEKSARAAARKTNAKAKTTKKAKTAEVTEAEGDHEEAED
jgi:hypothetical protein